MIISSDKTLGEVIELLYKYKEAQKDSTTSIGYSIYSKVIEDLEEIIRKNK